MNDKTNAINNYSDTISNNMTKAYAISVVLQAAIENDCGPTKPHLVNTIWAISDLLGEAEQAEERILEIEHGHKRGEKPQATNSGADASTTRESGVKVA
ncbi:hypothetical protein Q4602_02110 [Paraglaciecola chathamensis]|uniref:hypothetical protein n=1 Tax=Paraglaciecola chathamensis TaxID=368405 RepID=UPI0027096C71|nr:hypothetical protein [Paraglaciecola chathamensis]MDO6838251.1 hypothetical protein [Paraglaciecola chathamensis]